MQTKVKTKSVSDTTDNVGDINLSLNISSGIPVCFLDADGSSTLSYVFFRTSSGWWMKLLNDSTPSYASSKTVSGTLYYFEI